MDSDAALVRTAADQHMVTIAVQLAGVEVAPAVLQVHAVHRLLTLLISAGAELASARVGVVEDAVAAARDGVVVSPFGFRISVASALSRSAPWRGPSTSDGTRRRRGIVSARAPAAGAQH